MVAAAKMLIEVLLHTCFATLMFTTITFITVPSKTEFIDSLTHIFFLQQLQVKT